MASIVVTPIADVIGVSKLVGTVVFISTGGGFIFTGGVGVGGGGSGGIVEDCTVGLFKILNEAVSERGASTSSHHFIVSFLAIVSTNLVGVVTPAGLLVVGEHGILATSLASVAAFAVGFDKCVHEIKGLLCVTSFLHDGIISPLGSTALLVCGISPAGVFVFWVH